jgi:glycosyltransferase involved in cell wall biosynthesis
MIADTQRQKPPLSVMMLGLRGFPGVQGGVENHCENLCPLLADMGCQVTVLARATYQSVDIGPVWKKVKFVHLWSPKFKGLEAIAHTFLGVLYAAIKRPDILHIHGIGSNIMTPLARLLGLRVVMTHHGPDYDRQKWGGFARFMLKLGECWGVRYANGRIVISKVIEDLLRTKYQAGSELVPNGVSMPTIPSTTTALDEFGLQKGRYVLFVSRLVPEKRHLDLIEAFKQADIPDWKLVLVGGADHPDAYHREVIAKANETGVVLTGIQFGLALQELFAHAGLFVLPSSHEGLPIVMLEALSFGLPVLASDIPANLEVGMEAKHYFPLGNIQALADNIKQWSIEGPSEAAGETIRYWVTQHYNWQHIAEKTLQLYTSCVEEK